MDIEVENVTAFKEEEEEEDPLSVTCQELNIKKEVSCVCVIEKACACTILMSLFFCEDDIAGEVYWALLWRLLATLFPCFVIPSLCADLRHLSVMGLYI
jgi:hypothetical protein